MQFSIYSLLSLGMAAVAIADIRFANRTGTQVFTPGGNVIPAGQPYQITWNVCNLIIQSLFLLILKSLTSLSVRREAPSL